jgi:multimeric flavodoxin WrbA
MEIEKFREIVDHLKGKDKILFILTSNRWDGHKEVSKSSTLAFRIQQELPGKTITTIDVSRLKIYECEGNVSSKDGNNCGVKAALLENANKGLDKTGHHRCWASFNHKDDELYKVVNELLTSDVVMFFGSIRWGKMNAVYSRLIERLTWLENRHATLGESNIIQNIETGVVSVGHNWNGRVAVDTEKEVLGFFGFKTPKQLFWSYQWTKDKLDETKKGYKQDWKDFDNFLSLTEEDIVKFEKFTTYR